MSTFGWWFANWMCLCHNIECFLALYWLTITLNILVDARRTWRHPCTTDVCVCVCLHNRNLLLTFVMSHNITYANVWRKLCYKVLIFARNVVLKHTIIFIYLGELNCYWMSNIPLLSHLKACLPLIGRKCYQFHHVLLLDSSQWFQLSSVLSTSTVKLVLRWYLIALN